MSSSKSVLEIDLVTTGQDALLQSTTITESCDQPTLQQYGDLAPLFPHKTRHELAHPTVEILPQGSTFRRTVSWPGMGVEFVRTSTYAKTEFRFRAPVHLLVAYERGVRLTGETFVEGLQPSNLRHFSRKLTCVPAGHEYREWLEPRTPSNIIFFYFPPVSARANTILGERAISLEPRLFFEDATLWSTVLKLSQVISSPASENAQYLEALGSILVHELTRLSHTGTQPALPSRGGLAAWQQRLVADYIEEHLSQTISLTTLSDLVNLSRFHFCRTFKQSFGVSPHRYHMSRRIERAKVLLARRSCCVTDIGLTVGYSDTSSFTTAFRKATGLTPRDFHRTIKNQEVMGRSGVE